MTDKTHAQAQPVDAVGARAERVVGRPVPKRAKPLHARLSSARGLLIEWRNVLRKSGPPTERERPGFDAEMAMFDAAIRAVAEARDHAKADVCWCAACDCKANLFPSRMSVCPKCGDKRCPRAEHHSKACGKTPNVGAKATTAAQMNDPERHNLSAAVGRP